MIPDSTLFGIETEAIDTNRAVALTINLQIGAASSDSIYSLALVMFLQLPQGVMAVAICHMASKVKLAYSLTPPHTARRRSSCVGGFDIPMGLVPQGFYILRGYISPWIKYPHIVI